MSESIWTDTGEELDLEKTKEETDRKCPQCGGVMDFDPQTGGMRCPYCDYTQAIAAQQDDGTKTAEELDFESALHKENCDWGVKKKVVICKACGAQLVYDELEIANACPYCGSNQVMEEKGDDTLAPGGVVPFAVTVKEAAAKFAGWIRRKLFCPRAAKQSAKPDAFKGVYLPYWTFDARTVSDYAGEYGIDRRVRDREGRERVVTDWHPCSGRYREDIDDELVLASTRYPESLIREVEPFRTSENKAYQPEYVAGFIAERYSLGLKDAWEKAKAFIGSRLRARIEEQLRMQHRADHVRIRNVRTSYFGVTYKYLLLPVWLSSYRYKGKIYHFMVNGQSGKAGGQVPVSPMRVGILFLLLLAVFLLFSDYALYGGILLLLAGVLSVVCYVMNM